MSCANNFHQPAKVSGENERYQGKVHDKKNIQISFSQAEAMTFFKKNNELLQDICLDEKLNR